MSKDLKSPEHLPVKWQRLIYWRWGKVYNSVESLVNSLATDSQLWAEEKPQVVPQPTIEQIRDTVLAGTVINAARLVEEQAQAESDQNAAEKLATVYQIHKEMEQDELAA